MNHHRQIYKLKKQLKELRQMIELQRQQQEQIQIQLEEIQQFIKIIIYEFQLQQFNNNNTPYLM